MKILDTTFAFEWDSGNRQKNFIKHRVNDEECEEVFFDPEKKILRDTLHSGREERYIILGATQRLRILFVIFTVRNGSIRVISARDLNKKEKLSMKKKLKIPKFRSEHHERMFWSRVKLQDHFDARDFESVSFPNLKPSSRSIALRIPDFLLVRIKERAHELDIPYQSLIKEYIAKGVLSRR